MSDRELLADDAPMSLIEACEGPLRGLARPSTLRTAIADGKLDAMRIGNRYVVTPAALRRWMDSCRVIPKAAAKPLTRSEPSVSKMAFAATLNKQRQEAKGASKAARSK